MTDNWLLHGEEIVGSWHVFIGEDGPSTAKITGQLHVTNRNVHFEAGLSLKENAGVEISNEIRAFETSDKHVTIPITEIDKIRITRKYLILKSLHIISKSGGELILRFGAMSPKSAANAISSRLSHQSTHRG
ncbi:MAG TPA: hypothetical protein VLP30_01085 [Desulfatirhabdiaceae bacterium]|nr:hypothetical protein [Desulfatirhabdiaceae bacterium]